MQKHPGLDELIGEILDTDGTDLYEVFYFRKKFEIKNQTLAGRSANRRMK